MNLMNIVIPMAFDKETGKPKKLKVIKTTRDRAVSAYEILEIDEESVRKVPKIEHLFRGIGGKQKVFEYLEGSEEPEARKILDLRDRLSQHEANALPFEAFCVAAGIPVKKMFGIISQEVMEQSAKATALLAKARHTEVVQATIENALLPTGDKDRKMLHQAEGFVPVPKNSVTNIYGNQTIDARTQQKIDVAILPSVEDGVRAISDRFNDQIDKIDESKMIEAPIIDLDDEDEDDDE